MKCKFHQWNRHFLLYNCAKSKFWHKKQQKQHEKGVTFYLVIFVWRVRQMLCLSGGFGRASKRKTRMETLEVPSKKFANLWQDSWNSLLILGGSDDESWQIFRFTKQLFSAQQHFILWQICKPAEPGTWVPAGTWFVIRNVKSVWTGPKPQKRQLSHRFCCELTFCMASAHSEIRLGIRKPGASCVFPKHENPSQIKS